MADVMSMSLDDIIKQNKNQNQRVSRSRGRGNSGGSVRGRGGGGGGGRGGGRGGGGRGGGGRGRGAGRGRGFGRSQSQSRSGTPGPWQGRARSRSRSRGPNARQTRSQSRARSQSRQRSQSRTRSRSRQFRANSRARSASRSRSRLRGLTPRGRAGLEEQIEMPPLIVNKRGGMRGRLRRTNSNPNLQGVHGRLGVVTRRGAANLRSFGLTRGVAKRGRGLITGNRYSNVGLRSDQILKEQRMLSNILRSDQMLQDQLLLNNMIKSQTFRRSRNNSFSSPNSQLTVSVANDFAKRRRNSVGNAGYLNQQTLAQLTTQLGGYNTRRGPGSVKSMGSNRSNRSSRSNQSNRSNRSRGRGRGRGGNRGVGRKFNNAQVLNPKLQKEIADIQGKSYSSEVAATADAPSGVSCTLTPSATKQTLHQRFATK